MRHRGEKNWEDIHTPREGGMGPNPVVSCKSVQEFGTNKASRRRGRRLPGKRGKERCFWQREQHVQRLKETELQRGYSGLRGGERRKPRQVRLAEAGP